MKTTIVCLTDNIVYYRFRSGWVGLGWVLNTVGWVGLGPASLDPCPSLWASCACSVD